MNQDELQELVRKFLSGSATTDEQQRLSAWYRHQADGEALWVLDTSTGADELKAGLLQEIKKQTGMMERPVADKDNHTIAHRRLYRFAAAAAVLIIGIITFVAVSFNRSFNKSSLTVSAKASDKILPGSDRAMLTLADGSIIVLDSAANGMLAQQGSTQVVKLSDGRVAYNFKGVSAGKALMNTISTPKGGKYQVVLPDGSKVWLNAASSITYPTVFTGNTREVEVAGEAYLEIAKNSKQPFYVRTSKTTVQVLGTSFNINAYSDEQAERTTLIDGSVRVLSNGVDVLLKPGQVASIKEKINITNANIEQVLAWKNGYFNFDDADIQTIMRSIARWYDVEIVYQGAMPTDIFMGKLHLRSDINQMLNTLKGAGIDFKIVGRKIIVIK